jgi:hypothetical protein
MEQLRDLPLDKIERACTEALKRLKRMPWIADIRELANERSTDALYQRDERIQEYRLSPLLTEVREIGEGIAIDGTVWQILQRIEQR